MSCIFIQLSKGFATRKVSDVSFQSGKDSSLINFQKLTAANQNLTTYVGWNTATTREPREPQRTHTILTIEEAQQQGLTRRVSQFRIGYVFGVEKNVPFLSTLRSKANSAGPFSAKTKPAELQTVGLMIKSHSVVCCSANRTGKVNAEHIFN